MAMLDTKHDRAALVILVLGAALIVALSPFATGLIGIPVLYVIFQPLHGWLAKRSRPQLSAKNTDVLRQRFKNVTISTVIGTGAVAVIQGTLVGIAFLVTGLGNALFWGVVTVMLAILPVVGSGLVWIPGAIALFLSHQAGWAVGMVLWGVLVVGNVDYVIRPIIFRRWANIHPLITLLGALAG